MNWRIENGLVIDPANGIERVATVVVRDGKVAAIEQPGRSIAGGTSFDATGMVVAPGFFDMHVHFRDPGLEYKEDIETGSQAAVRGGFTAVACMANTDPVNDTPSVTEYIIKRARQVGLIDVFPIAAVSKGLKGEELTEFGALKAAGAVAFSDDGMPVRSSRMMRRALEYAAQFNMTIIDHCEDLDLGKDGVMNEGACCSRLGLKGMPTEAESNMVYRDIRLARLTGGKVHIAHMSCRESVLQVARGKAEGIRVTGEVTPHHLFLADEEILQQSFNTHLKCKPPLTSKEDIAALRAGLKEGAIDVIATDHAPHAAHEKHTVFENAPFGMIGLQTALPLGLELVASGVLTLGQLIEKMTVNPAKVLGLALGHLGVGAAADLVVFDPKAPYTLNAGEIVSKSKNSPFLGKELKGLVRLTLKQGRQVYSRM